MKAQFSKGRRFVTFTIMNEDVQFMPIDKWQFIGHGEWGKGCEAEFIVQGYTKKGAEVIDYDQPIVCIVKEMATSKKVFERRSHFYPDEKQPGVRQKIPAPVPGRKTRSKGKVKQLSDHDIYKLELETACGALRQCLRLLSTFAEKNLNDPPLCRQVSERIQTLLTNAVDASALIFPCLPPHYLGPEDSARWENGSLHDIPFSNTIRQMDQLFTLCRRTEDNRYIALFDLKLERNGMWTTPDFAGMNGILYPQVSHRNFSAAIMWLVRFSDREDGGITDFPLKVFCQDDPIVERKIPTTPVENTGLVVAGQNE